METSNKRQQFLVLPNVATSNNQVILLQQPVASNGNIPVVLTNSVDNPPITVVGTSASATPTNLTKSNHKTAILHVPRSYISGATSGIQSSVVLGTLSKSPLSSAIQSSGVFRNANSVPASRTTDSSLVFATLNKGSLTGAQSSATQGSVVLRTLNNVPTSSTADTSVVFATLNKVPSAGVQHGSVGLTLSKMKASTTTGNSVVQRTLNSAPQLGTTISRTAPNLQGKKIIVQAGVPGGLSVVVNKQNVSSSGMKYVSLMTMPKNSNLASVLTSRENAQNVTGLTSVAKSTISNTTVSMSASAVMSQSGRINLNSQSSSTSDKVHPEPKTTLYEQPSLQQLLTPATSIATNLVMSAKQPGLLAGVPLGPPVVTSRIVNSTQVSSSQSRGTKSQTSVTTVSTTTRVSGSFPKIKNFPQKSGPVRYKNVSVNLNGVVQKLLVPINEETVGSGESNTSNASSSSSGTIAATQTTTSSTIATPATITVMRNPVTSTSAIRSGLTTVRQLSQDGRQTSVVMPFPKDASKSQKFGTGPSIVLQQNGAPGNIIRGTLLGVSSPHTNNKIVPLSVPQNRFLIHRTKVPSQVVSSSVDEVKPHIKTEKSTTEESASQPRLPEKDHDVGEFKIDSVFSLSEKKSQSTNKHASPSRFGNKSESLLNILNKNNLLSVSEGSTSNRAVNKHNTANPNLLQNVKPTPRSKCQICLLHQSKTTGHGPLCKKYHIRPLHIPLHTLKRRQHSKNETRTEHVNVKKRKLDEKDETSSREDKKGVSSFGKQKCDSLPKSSNLPERVCSDVSGNSNKGELNISKPNFSKYFLVKSHTGCFLVPRCENQGNGESETQTVYKVVEYNTGKAVVMRSGAGAKKLFVEQVDKIDEDPSIMSMIQADNQSTSQPESSTPSDEKETTGNSGTDKTPLSHADRIKALKEKMKAQEEELERLRKEREQSVSILDILEDI